MKLNKRKNKYCINIDNDNINNDNRNSYHINNNNKNNSVTRKDNIKTQKSHKFRSSRVLWCNPPYCSSININLEKKKISR